VEGAGLGSEKAQILSPSPGYAQLSTFVKQANSVHFSLKKSSSL